MDNVVFNKYKFNHFEVLYKKYLRIIFKQNNILTVQVKGYFFFLLMSTNIETEGIY